MNSPSSKPPCHVDVLLVDDSSNLCRTLKLWMATKGYSVATAGSAAEAEKLAAAATPKVVITDLGLPDCSGHVLRERLRATEAMQQTCFMALSGDTDGQEIEQALQVGFNHFISKPPDFEKLADALEHCLRTRSGD